MFSFRIWPKLAPNPHQLLVPVAVFFSPNMRPFARFCDVKRFPLIAYCVPLIREIGCNRNRTCFYLKKTVIFIVWNKEVYRLTQTCISNNIYLH